MFDQIDCKLAFDFFSELDNIVFAKKIDASFFWDIADISERFDKLESEVYEIELVLLFLELNNFNIKNNK